MPDEIDEENAVAQFNNAVAAKVQGGMTRDNAIAAVARREPALHRAYIRATNQGRIIPEVYQA